MFRHRAIRNVFVENVVHLKFYLNLTAKNATCLFVLFCLGCFCLFMFCFCVVCRVVLLVLLILHCPSFLYSVSTHHNHCPVSDIKLLLC